MITTYFGKWLLSGKHNIWGLEPSSKCTLTQFTDVGLNLHTKTSYSRRQLLLYWPPVWSLSFWCILNQMNWRSLQKWMMMMMMKWDCWLGWVMDSLLFFISVHWAATFIVSWHKLLRIMDVIPALTITCISSANSIIRSVNIAIVKKIILLY